MYKNKKIEKAIYEFDSKLNYYVVVKSQLDELVRLNRTDTEPEFLAKQKIFIFDHKETLKDIVGNGYRNFGEFRKLTLRTLNEKILDCRNGIKMYQALNDDLQKAR